MGDLIHMNPSREQLVKLQQEHEICQRRGHEAVPSFWTDSDGVSWFTCKWCETSFSHQSATVLMERNQPIQRIEESYGSDGPTNTA